MAGETKKVDITTGVGTLCFPRLFPSTKGKKDDNVTDVYDVMILIPKTQRDDLKAIVRAIREVGQAKWDGDTYKRFSAPLRDGDKEADELCEDGKTTKREKYPERLGCYFMNARSTKPIAVVARDRTPINDPEAVYGGCKAKINVTFYPYNTKGKQGIAAGLNGVQFIAHGEPFGKGAPTVESMFDMLEDEDDTGLEDDLDAVEPEEEPTPPPAKKTVAKKAATPAQKKAAAARKAAAEAAAAAAAEADEDDDLDGLGEDDDADGLYDDLDDSDS